MGARLRKLRHRELDGIPRDRLRKMQDDLINGLIVPQLSEYVLTSVTNLSDLFTITGENTLAADLPRVVFYGDDIPAPLEPGEIYWLFDAGVDQYSVAASKEDANAGTAIALSDDGSGTITMVVLE